MKDFTIFPAIDLHKGQVVRLRQGDLNQKTVYFDRPSDAARLWLAQGAQYLHVVNLDGAFGNAQEKNISALKEILAIANGSAPVQLGGGLRDLASMAYALELGVTRLVIGTIAVTEPDIMHGALKTFGPERIVLGVDARQGKVRVAGWQKESQHTPQTLVQQFLPDNLQTIIYTNINRDGMGSGPDIAGAKALAADTGVQVIASGGVHTVAHIEAIKAAGLPGVVVGRALYQKQFTLSEVITC